MSETVASPRREVAALHRAIALLGIGVLLAVVVAGLVTSWPSILGHPLEWAMVLGAMVMCSVLTVSVSSIDPFATLGITTAMIGVLSPAHSVLSVLLIWSVGAFIGFVIRRRRVDSELRRVSRLLLPAFVYIVTWIAVSPDQDAPVWLVATAATAAILAYVATGTAVVAVSAVLRGFDLRLWLRSLRPDLIAGMIALNIALALTSRGLTRFIEDRSATDSSPDLPTLEGILVIALLGAAAVAADGLIESHVARTRLNGIVAAAVDLPWPEDRNGVALATAYAARTVRADRVVAETAPGHGIGAISAPIRLPSGETVHLVARRRPGRAAFIDLDRAALAAVAGIAAESMRTSTRLDALELESQTDPLTGLANYRGLQSALDAIRIGRRVSAGMAVIYIDMDGFKQVNDQYGHETGNEVLRRVAARLRSAVRPNDLVVRAGGDEFVVLLTDVDDRAHAEAVGERIRRSATAPLSIGATSVPIGFSFGIAFSEDPDIDPAALIDWADVQMYQARGLRPATDEDDDPASADVSSIVDTAIRGHALEVHYQPVVDAGSGLVTAIEALVRLHDSAVGWVPAPLLVREARRLGLLPELTAQVLRQAFLDADALGPSTGPLHVNIDVDEVADDGFLDLVATLRAAHPTVRLLLELGEDSLHRTSPEVVERIARLRDSGVQVALDDFGKAHSTLLAIAQLPVDAIKIDRSLIQGIEDVRSRHLISSLARLAKRLLIRVVVEGVETERERELLVELGVAEMQGYLFARPMPVEALAEYLTAATAQAMEHWRRAAPSAADEDE